jgi:hypothetical protein
VPRPRREVQRSSTRRDGGRAGRRRPALPLGHGITVFPFLWSREAQEDLAATTRGPAPMTELFALQDEFAARSGQEPDATAGHIHVE